MSSEKHCVRCGAGSASRRGNICMACGEEAPANEDDGAGRDSSISYTELMSKAAMHCYSIDTSGPAKFSGVPEDATVKVTVTRCIHGTRGPCHICKVLPPIFRDMKFDGVDALPNDWFDKGGKIDANHINFIWLYRAACQAVQGAREIGAQAVFDSHGPDAADLVRNSGTVQTFESAEAFNKDPRYEHTRGGGGGGPDCGVAIIQWPHTGGGGLGEAVREFVQMVPAIDTAEAPPPYALTAAQLPGLERAIRAEGYAVLLDTESGEVVLMKPTEDKRLRAPVGRMEQALRAILSRIQFGGEPYPGLIEQLCKEGLGE